MLLQELEDDLNIMDDAYIVLVKEYFIDGNGKIRMHRIKEVYRGDPVTMFIYSDENGQRGTKGFHLCKSSWCYSQRTTRKV